MARIRPATREFLEQWLALRLQLWPQGAAEEHLPEMEAMLVHERQVALLYVSRENQVLGFVEVALRDVAEGCDSSPVGYLEGWFVTEEARLQGIGRALVKAAEEWSRQKGCTEFASDTELNNMLSRTVHHRLGFDKVETLVHFRKKL